MRRVVDIAPVYNLSDACPATHDETYVTNLQTLIDRGDVDGLLLRRQPVQNAVLSLLEESGIPYIVRH